MEVDKIENKDDEMNRIIHGLKSCGYDTDALIDKVRKHVLDIETENMLKQESEFLDDSDDSDDAMEYALIAEKEYLEHQIRCIEARKKAIESLSS